jgi:hypothetical protein
MDDYYEEIKTTKTFYPRDDSIEEWRRDVIKKMQRRLLRDFVLFLTGSIVMLILGHLCVYEWGSFTCVNLGFVSGVYMAIACSFYKRRKKIKREEHIKQEVIRLHLERMKKRWAENV